MTVPDYKFGISDIFPCNYLAGEKERLLITIDERLQNSASYGWLMEQGFRRSGSQSYRPYCIKCNACQSIRVLVNSYLPSKSQKRSLKRNKNLQIRYSAQLKTSYYPLYEQYINTFHQDGSMYPATYKQFESFLSSGLTKQLFIETWHIEARTEGNTETLVCVAVTDHLKNALSAVYTFYHPDYKSSGLGVFSILTQIAECKKMALPYLYLGYQIDACQKMNYKDRYFPYERFVNNQWELTNK